MAINSVSSELLHKVIFEELNHQLRTELRRKFDGEAQKIVDEAVEAAMESFKPIVDSYYNLYGFENIVRVIFEDNRKT